jgi:hypothetical protein
MPEHTDENGEPYFDTVEEERAWRYGADEVHPGIERFESGVVGNYVKQQELDIQAEAEWHEREKEQIPSWMDEEEITAREWAEGLDEDYGHYANDAVVENYTQARYAETPEDIDERIKAYQENYGETAEERVEAYQEEAREEERESAFRIKAW